MGASGSTTDGILTYTSTTSATVESNLKFNTTDGLVITGKLDYSDGDRVNLIEGSPTSGQFGNGAKIAELWPASGFTVTAGDIYYMLSGGGYNTWSKARANAESTVSHLLVMATDATDSREMLLQGIIASSTDLSGGSVGDPVYVSDSTAGGLTLTPPTTTGTFVRAVGHLITPARSVIYFNPSPDYIEN